MEEDKNWKGYTLEELRYRRLLTSAKIEVSKASMMGQFQQATNPQGAAGALMGRIVGSFNYLEYALLAFRVGKKIYSYFKK